MLALVIFGFLGEGHLAVGHQGRVGSQGVEFSGCCRGFGLDFGDFGGVAFGDLVKGCSVRCERYEALERGDFFALVCFGEGFGGGVGFCGGGGDEEGEQDWKDGELHVVLGSEEMRDVCLNECGERNYENGPAGEEEEN